MYEFYESLIEIKKILYVPICRWNGGKYKMYTNKKGNLNVLIKYIIQLKTF